MLPPEYQLPISFVNRQIGSIASSERSGGVRKAGAQTVALCVSG